MREAVRERERDRDRRKIIYTTQELTILVHSALSVSKGTTLYTHIYIYILFFTMAGGDPGRGGTRGEVELERDISTGVRLQCTYNVYTYCIYTRVYAIR